MLGSHFKQQVYEVLVTQSFPTLCNPMDYSPPGFSIHGSSPGKNSGVGCHALLHCFFPTQESNPGLLHCRQILYHLSHQGNPLKQQNHQQKAQNFEKCGTKWPVQIMLFTVWELEQEGRISGCLISAKCPETQISHCSVCTNDYKSAASTVSPLYLQVQPTVVDKKKVQKVPKSRSWICLQWQLFT